MASYLFAHGSLEFNKNNCTEIRKREAPWRTGYKAFISRIWRSNL